MELEKIQHIKNIVLISLFSDDKLMELLVLKGASAIDLIYGVAKRSSLDIDLSVPCGFTLEEFENIKDRIRKTLEQTFLENGYKVFDLSVEEKPPSLPDSLKSFWGGYQIEFKIIEIDKYEKIGSDITELRKYAKVVGVGQRKKLIIDISKHEFCDGKQSKEIEGITIYFYTPEMIAIEKLRAICQQMPEYLTTVDASIGAARARDFVDICILVDRFGIKLDTEDNQEVMTQIFRAKRVPLNLIMRIKDYREFHRPDFQAVRDTVVANFDLKDFDYYFNYVVRLCDDLKPFWEE